MKRKGILLVILLMVFALAIAGCGETTTPERVDENNNAEANDPDDDNNQEEEASGFGVGDKVKMGDLEFVVNSARWDEGDEYTSPDAGTMWIVVDVTIENQGSESEAISSLMMFELYDMDGYSQEMAYFVSTKGSLDGELGAGRKMSGELAFEVEEDHTEWEFIFAPNFLGFGQAIYDISVDDIQ